MTPQEQNDLLIRMDAKLSLLCRQFKKAAEGEGFPRCADRGARLKDLEDWKKTMEKLVYGLVATVGAASIGALIAAIV